MSFTRIILARKLGLPPMKGVHLRICGFCPHPKLRMPECLSDNAGFRLYKFRNHLPLFPILGHAGWAVFVTF